MSSTVQGSPLWSLSRRGSAQAHGKAQQLALAPLETLHSCLKVRSQLLVALHPISGYSHPVHESWCCETALHDVWFAVVPPI